MKALIHANSYDFHTYRTGGYLLFDRTIREVGPMERFPGADEVWDCRNALVMPGLNNGHAHIYTALARGIALPFRPENFRQLLEQLWWKVDRQIDEEAAYHSAMVHGIEHLKAGVTTIIDHHASGLAIRGTLRALKRAICNELGMRGIFCFETSDRFAVDECIAENLDFIRGESADNCAGLFGMHASLSLSDATLEKVARVIGDIPVHVHVAESVEDETHSLARYGKRCVQRFYDHGVLNRNSLLAHCVHIDSSEAEIIADSGCYVAINPASNLNNAVGLPDYRLFKKYQIPTIIGNDSLGVNLARDYQDTLFCMHMRGGNPWEFSGNDLLNCIRNVYDYAGSLLGISIGRLEPGYVADMTVLPYYPPTPLTKTNIFGHLAGGVFGRFHPREVWCGGELRLQNHEPVRNEAEVYAAAAVAAAKLWRRIDPDIDPHNYFGFPNGELRTTNIRSDGDGRVDQVDSTIRTARLRGDVQQ
jgi:cytosine/adenosine deaminase-related metal-dependent hydrolase